jgi:hypothetical protein
VELTSFRRSLLVALDSVSGQVHAVSPLLGAVVAVSCSAQPPVYTCSQCTDVLTC